MDFEYGFQNLIIRILNSGFGFLARIPFSVRLPTSRITDTAISQDGRSAGVVSFGVPACRRSRPTHQPQEL